MIDHDVELGGEFYKSFGALNGQPAGVLLIYLLPGANQIESAKGVYAEMDRLERFFPDDVDYAISYDTTPAVQASISGIVQTFKKRLGAAVNITVHQVQTIAPEKSGKFRYVVSRVADAPLPESRRA